MPICGKCGTEFPNRIIIDGKEHNVNHRKYCINCSPFGKHNTLKLEIRTIPLPRSRNNSYYVSKMRRSRAIKAVNYKGGKCKKCGYDKCIAALDFHHRNAEDKSFTISSGCTKKWDTLVKELDKCDLLCANCHREYHDEYDC